MIWYQSVSVCAVQQNVKLVLDVVKLSKLIELTLCDQNNAVYMLQRCDDCPGESPLREYLCQNLLDEGGESSKISFKGEIVLRDFAENYQFIIYEIHGFSLKLFSVYFTSHCDILQSKHQHSESFSLFYFK